MRLALAFVGFALLVCPDAGSTAVQADEPALLNASAVTPFFGGFSEAETHLSRPLSLVVPIGHSSVPSGTLVQQVSMTPETSSDDSTWVLVAPYVWAPAMRGTVGARGVTAPVDLTLGDLIESIPDLNGAFMGHIEVGRGDWGLLVDGMLMQTESSGRGPNGAQIDLEISSTILESMIMRRLIDVETDTPGMSRIRVDALTGLRYYQVQNDLRIRPVVDPPVSATLSKNWVDLVVGARTAVTVAEGLDGFLQADFGGFGIGTSSDLTWNLMTGVEYACPSLPGSSLILGYRILDIDETQKSGANQFVYDVKIHGPFSAIAFRF